MTALRLSKGILYHQQRTKAPGANSEGKTDEKRKDSGKNPVFTSLNGKPLTVRVILIMRTKIDSFSDKTGKVYKKQIYSRFLLKKSAIHGHEEDFLPMRDNSCILDDTLIISDAAISHRKHLHLDLFMKSVTAVRMNCWTLRPAAAAAARIAAPVSLSGRIMMLSRLLFHFADAFL